MPLSAKGRKILSHMRQTYKGEGGEKKAKSVFYASINAGKIHGAEKGRAEGGPIVPTAKRLPFAPLPYEQSPPVQPAPVWGPRPGPMPKVRGGHVSAYRAEGGPIVPQAYSPELMERARLLGSGNPLVQAMERTGKEQKRRLYIPESKMRARGGHVDAHEEREKQLIGELARMQRHRARGGPAAEGAYMVGERGPELFVPDQSGTIIPHHEITRLARKYGGRVSHMRAEGGPIGPGGERKPPRIEGGGRSGGGYSGGKEVPVHPAQSIVPDQDPSIEDLRQRLLGYKTPPIPPSKMKARGGRVRVSHMRRR
jgi:hypothetical protein